MNNIHTSEGADMIHMLRVLRYHNSKGMREFRAKRGDPSPLCDCEMCAYANRQLNSCTPEPDA